MTERDKKVLTTRLRKLQNEFTAQLHVKKAFRNERDMENIKKSIATIKGWLGLKVKLTTVEDLMPKEKMQEEEFKKLFREAVNAPEDDILIVEVNSREDIDRLWPQVKMKPVQFKCPPELIPYLQSKANAERPYQYINKK